MRTISRRGLLAAAPLAAAAQAASLRQALAAWAEEDADAEERAGRTGFAREIRADAARAAEPRGRTAPEALFPRIARTNGNPWLDDAVRRASALGQSAARYPKGPEGNVVHDHTGWRFINICTQALDLTRALCHPQSPLAGDPRLVAPMLRRYATVYEYLTPGAKNLSDFGISPWLSEMYLLLRTVYPDLILPVYRTAWEKAIDVNAEAIAALYGPVFAAAQPGTGYPNAHTHYINALLFAGRILDRKRYLDLAASGVKLMATCLYADGGFCYIGWQNECFTYHGIAVKDLERYAQVTGTGLARELAVRSRWYYPLSIEPPGVAEYSTSPSWKPYWNQGTGSDGAAVVAGLTGCPHNVRIVRENPPAGDLWLAAFYRDDVKPAPAPDRYITWDGNIEGPRGRFGAFSFSGTTRDYRDDERGKQSYVGCMALDPGSKAKWPLSAALHSAGAEVRIKPGPGGLNRWDTHLCLARSERNECTVTREYAALATVHRLSVYKGPATGWECRQQWLLTPRRLVGLIELEPLATQRAFSMGASILLVSGRGGWGVRKEFRKLDERTWQYGALVVRVHAQDFGLMETGYTDIMSGDTKRSGRIVLADGNGAECEYAAGTRRFALVEIFPEWNGPAASVERAGGGISLRDGQAEFRYAPGQGRGERYRATWLA